MARPKGSRTGRCQGCNHVERMRIERFLAAGASRRALRAGSLSGLTRPVPSDAVLQVVDMRDTAIVGHRNYVIAHDLACPPGHFVNRI
jgi:hypothetical protein